jgi:hypothetical protein
MTLRFFFKRFVPAAVAFAAIWMYRDELDKLAESNSDNGS